MSSIEMLCAGLDDVIEFAKEIRAPLRTLSLVEELSRNLGDDGVR
jgi:hypothetical protein